VSAILTVVQDVPLDEYAIGEFEIAGVPVSSHELPFQAIPRPNCITFALLLAIAVHLMPLSVEYAIDTPPAADVPVATSMYPFHAILYAPLPSVFAVVPKGVSILAVQVFPSAEYKN
jgi:hypothetical protein